MKVFDVVHMMFCKLLQPYIRAELPGWGKLYERGIGGYEVNTKWAGSAPRIIRDKRNGYFRVLNIREWADRLLYFLGRWYDLEAALAIEAIMRPGDQVLDIGANYGHFSLASAAAIGPKGRLISAEPNPLSFARLQMHVYLNQLAYVETHNIGLSDEPGELTLNIPKINSGEASFAPSAYDDVSQVTCPVSTVDMLVGEAPIDFIKIDVEGFEVSVLRGAKNLLALHTPIVLTEIVDAHLERAGATRADLFAILSDLDYRPYRLGLKKIGFTHTLQLTPFTEEGPDGDALWVPESRRDRLTELLVDKQ